MNAQLVTLDTARASIVARNLQARMAPRVAPVTVERSTICTLGDAAPALVALREKMAAAGAEVRAEQIMASVEKARKVTKNEKDRARRASIKVNNPDLDRARKDAKNAKDRARRAAKKASA